MKTANKLIKENYKKSTISKEELQQNSELELLNFYCYHFVFPYEHVDETSNSISCMNECIYNTFDYSLNKKHAIIYNSLLMNHYYKKYLKNL